MQYCSQTRFSTPLDFMARRPTEAPENWDIRGGMVIIAQTSRREDEIVVKQACFYNTPPGLRTQHSLIYSADIRP